MPGCRSNDPNGGSEHDCWVYPYQVAGTAARRDAAPPLQPSAPCGGNDGTTARPPSHAAAMPDSVYAILRSESFSQKNTVCLQAKRAIPIARERSFFTLHPPRVETSLPSLPLRVSLGWMIGCSRMANRRSIMVEMAALTERRKVE